MADKEKAYDNLYLSDLEQKIIDANRNGAHVTVTYYDESDYKESTDKVMKFGNIENIRDIGTAVAFSKHNFHERWNVKAYLDI